MYKNMSRMALSTVLATSIAIPPQLAHAQTRDSGDSNSSSSSWSVLDHFYAYESLEVPINIIKEVAQMFGPSKNVTNEIKLPTGDRRDKSDKSAVQTLNLTTSDPEKATQTWKTFIASFSNRDSIVAPPKGAFNTSVGYFAVQKRTPLSTVSSTSHPKLRTSSGGGALGFRISFEFETPTEIFNACAFDEREYGGLDIRHLLGKIEAEARKKDNCDAANALRALELRDLRVFREKNGYTALLRALANGGHLQEFNREMEHYLRLENPSSQALESLRLSQLQSYGSVLPDRHVNPRGTIAENNYASEFVALIELFKLSYPSSASLSTVRQLETRLFADYISKFGIPVHPVRALARQNNEDKVLIYQQAALTPRALSIEYPNITWTADAKMIDKVLKGEDSLVESNCGCFIQESENSDPFEIAEVKGLGFSKFASSDKALDTCVRVAQGAALGKMSQAKIRPDIKRLKGYAFTHRCEYKPVTLSEPLTQTLKQEMKESIAREARMNAAYKSRPAFIQKLLVASLAFTMGAVTWRCRGGGGCPSFGTQTARLFYAVIPQTLFGGIFGYLEDGWGGVKDGAIIGALMTPSLMIPWGRQMDVGRAGGDRWEDFTILMLRGYVQTAPAAWYAASVGKDPSPILVSGVAMAPVYLTSWQWGSDVNINAFIDSPTAIAEAGWGGILTGYGLLKSVAPSWSPY